MSKWTSKKKDINKKDLRPIYAEIHWETYNKLKRLCFEMDRTMLDLLSEMIDDSYNSWEKAKKEAEK